MYNRDLKTFLKPAAYTEKLIYREIVIEFIEMNDRTYLFIKILNNVAQ